MKMHMVGQSPTAVRASWFHIVSAPLPSTAKRSTGIRERQAEDLLDRVALVVVGAGVGGRVAEAVGLGAAHVVGGQLEALDVHGVLLGAPADALRGQPDAVGEHVAEALALAHHADQLDHGLVVAEAQVDAAGVLGGDDAALEELHGEGDGHPGRHGVEAVLVGGAVGGDDGVGIGDAGGAAERVERLVLGAFGHDAAVGPGLREAHLAAGHRALGAGGAARRRAWRWRRRRSCPRTLVPGGRPVLARGRCRGRCSSPRCPRCPRGRTASRAPGCPSWRRACACAPP